MATNVFKVLLADWMIGGVLTLYMLAGYVADWSNLRLMENATYDLRSFLKAHGQQSDKIELVAVDQESLIKVGRWPWPRATQARLIENLRAGGAKVIVFAFPQQLSEADRSSQGMEEVRAMRQRLTAQIASPQTDARQREVYVRMLQELSESEARLDQDATFAKILAKSPDVVLPLSFDLGRPEAGETTDPGASIVASSFTQIDNPRDMSSFPPVKVRKLVAPLPVFQVPQVGFGHSIVTPDPDNVVRRTTLLVDYLDRFYPSLSLRAVASFLDVPPSDVHVTLGKGVKVGDYWIPTDNYMRMRISFNGPAGSFKPFSAYHVLGGKIPPSTFRGKLVIVGPTAATAGAGSYDAPTGHDLMGVELTANIIQNMLSQNFLTTPRWAPAIELSVILLVGVFVVLALPRLGAQWSGIVAGTLLASYIGFVVIAYASKGYVLTMVHPTLMLVLGYTFIAAKRALLAERGEATDVAAETNRMLGLTFQGQGMLELAFDKFRSCPIDESMKELLYNLGQDFERKRMSSKALSVYQHIATKDKAYKDIDSRMKRLHAAESGASGGKQGSGSLLAEGSDIKPTLGRYEIVKELGRGAMGIVYLGKDPKIHRSVAIKTMRLDEVEGEELPDVKARFFREAESAGKLSHPNIVTIFDAGEEQDLAYFAMEVLDGVDLKDLCKKRNLLPVKRTLEIVTKVSEALDYAHSQNVVHRDIKPANIMVMPDGTVKVTDFGIARVTTSVKTQTGIVLGTPSYMSPEQLSGAKVDGRSDLFSLGIVLFEMLTGERPFQGESVATLMYVIANQPHPSPFDLRPDLPKAVGAVIDRALQKDATKRYQRGLEMAQELRTVMQSLST